MATQRFNFGRKSAAPSAALERKDPEIVISKEPVPGAVAISPKFEPAWLDISIARAMNWASWRADMELSVLDNVFLRKQDITTRFYPTTANFLETFGPLKQGIVQKLVRLDESDLSKSREVALSRRVREEQKELVDQLKVQLRILNRVEGLVLYQRPLEGISNALGDLRRPRKT